MPNHITNIIAFDGDSDRNNTIKEAIKSDEHGIGTIDFKKIIPMPESLNIEAGSSTDRGMKAYRDFLEVYTLGGTANKDLSSIPHESEQAFLRVRTDIKKEDFELGKIAFENVQKYGAPTWYEWSINNWGTKWNAYSYDADTDYSTGEFFFQTAWSAPHPILQKLSEMYPDVTLTHKWADEDIGQNCGEREYFGGECIGEYTPQNEKEAYEFASDILGVELIDYGLALNVSGSKYINIDNDNLELISVLGKPALFSNGRITEHDIPKGLYCYDLREGDDGGRFATIESRVAVNHGGSIITKEPIDLSESGFISLTDETELNFLGGQYSMSEYMDTEFDENFEEEFTGGGQTL